MLIEGPRGDFLLEEEATEPAVFVAVDDGFAPIKSLIEHAIAIDNVARMYLYRIDDTPHGSMFGNLCRSWNDALDNFTYRRLRPQTVPADALLEIRKDIPTLAEVRVYVAGPAEWVSSFVAQAQTEGARPDRLRQLVTQLESHPVPDETRAPQNGIAGSLDAAIDYLDHPEPVADE